MSNMYTGLNRRQRQLLACFVGRPHTLLDTSDLARLTGMRNSALVPAKDELEQRGIIIVKVDNGGLGYQCADIEGARQYLQREEPRLLSRI